MFKRIFQMSMMTYVCFLSTRSRGISPKLLFPVDLDLFFRQLFPFIAIRFFQLPPTWMSGSAIYTIWISLRRGNFCGFACTSSLSGSIGPSRTSILLYTTFSNLSSPLYLFHVLSSLLSYPFPYTFPSPTSPSYSHKPILPLPSPFAPHTRKISDIFVNFLSLQKPLKNIEWVFKFSSISNKIYFVLFYYNIRNTFLNNLKSGYIFLNFKPDH